MRVTGQAGNLRTSGPFFFVKKKRILTSILFCVGAAGFEPAASWSQTRHSNRAELRPERLQYLSGEGEIRTLGTV